MIWNSDLANIDAASMAEPAFYRDPERLKIYALEHTMVIRGYNIPSILENRNIRSDLKEGYTEPKFSFRLPGDVQPASDVSCKKVECVFSKQYWSTLTYNEEDHMYYKDHSGVPQIDQHADPEANQLNFKNVLVLQSEQHYEGVYNLIDFTGGTGYYITEGTVREIVWEKGAYGNPIHIMTPEGEEVPVNAGKTYIAMLDIDAELTLE